MICWAFLCRMGCKGCLTAFLCAVFILGVSGCKQEKSNAAREEADPNMHFVFPQHGAYVGAYIDFGDSEDAVTLDAIEDFETMVQRHQAIIASSSFWGEQSFPAKNVEIISRHGAIPLLFWSPWDRPYQQNSGPDRFSLQNIVMGMWDKYIDDWADQARQFGKPLLVSWGLEMNGAWFPWSGYFNGAGTEASKDLDARFEGPELYKEAFRHVVERVRARGAYNILWGFHANNYSYPEEEWNEMARYYPGSQYLDWLGLSVYGKQFDDDYWLPFRDLMDAPYHEICDLDPGKPVLVAEWGIGEFPSAGNKAEWLGDALENLKTRYPRVKGAVYWHERWKNSDDTYSNLRLNSSPEALAAYQKGIADPHWLDRLEKQAKR